LYPDYILIQKGDELGSKNNDELRQICRENKLKGFSKCKNKSDFVRFILEHNGIIEQNIKEKIQDVSNLETRDDDIVDFVDSDADQSDDAEVSDVSNDAEVSDVSNDAEVSDVSDDFKLINIDDINTFFKNNFIYSKDKISV